MSHYKIQWGKPPDLLPTPMTIMLNGVLCKCRQIKML